MPAPKDLDSSVSLVALYGKKVRKLRIRAGWTQRELGAKAHVTHSRIAQFELGNEIPDEATSGLLDKVLNADGDLSDLWEHLERGPFHDSARKDWAGRFIDYEAKAIAMHKYLAHSIPGLLQTERYAREVMSIGQPWCTEEEVEKQVAGRLGRQIILSRDTPPLLWAVLDEAVVRRPVGGPAAMREQLAHVVESAKSPNIEVQVLPFAAGGHAAMGGSVTLLSFERGPDVAYLEGGAFGKVVRDTESVVQHSHRYDLVHAAALPPNASISFLEQVMEELRT